MQIVGYLELSAADCRGSVSRLTEAVLRRFLHGNRALPLPGAAVR